MFQFSLKLITIILILILGIHTFLFLVPLSYSFNNNTVQAAANLERDDVLKGFGLAVLLYIVSRIGQEIISPERITIEDLEESDENIELLARVIHAEARGEPKEGQIAVGAVVLNRLKSSDFPDNVYDIIFEDRQFSSVDDGQIYLSPNSSSFSAAEEALSGNDPTNGALYFYNPKTADPNNARWLEENTTPIKMIGDHLFAK